MRLRSGLVPALSAFLIAPSVVHAQARPLRLFFSTRGLSNAEDLNSAAQAPDADLGVNPELTVLVGHAVRLYIWAQLSPPGAPNTATYNGVSLRAKVNGPGAEITDVGWWNYLNTAPNPDYVRWQAISTDVSGLPTDVQMNGAAVTTGSGVNNRDLANAQDQQHRRFALDGVTRIDCTLIGYIDVQGNQTGAIEARFAVGNSGIVQQGQAAQPVLMGWGDEGSAPPGNQFGADTPIADAVIQVVVVRAYVDASARGANDGVDWANAFTSLQSALALGAGVSEIWVADGVYKPGALRTDSFALLPVVAVYGGFSGGETSLSQRRPRTNRTILSGDIGTPGSSSDNSFHVVTTHVGDAGTVLDGFTVTGGNANGALFPDNLGAGLLNSTGEAAIRNCAFLGNRASQGGAAIATISTAPKTLTISNCTFDGNKAGSFGGAIDIEGNSPTILNCTFTQNSAQSGGGIHVSGAGAPVLTNCILFDNGGTTQADQVVFGNAEPRVDYCDIQGYTGLPDGAGNIKADPNFVDANGADNIVGTLDDDLRLAAGSPCIDAGNGLAPGVGFRDAEGHPRAVDDVRTADTGVAVDGLVVDMGAFEFQAAPPGEADINGDGVVDLLDFAELMSQFTGP